MVLSVHGGLAKSPVAIQRLYRKTQKKLAETCLDFVITIYACPKVINTDYFTDVHLAQEYFVCLLLSASNKTPRIFQRCDAPNLANFINSSDEFFLRSGHCVTLTTRSYINASGGYIERTVSAWAV